MKRIIPIFLAVLIAAALFTACGPVEKTDDGKLSVVATTFAPYDLVRQIAGGRANTSMLLPPASESHSFEPTPQDTIKIQNCDVFIYVGGDSDAWVDKLLDSMDTGNMTIITLMDCVDTVEEELLPGMEEEEGDEPEEPEYDEHVWTSPKNTKLIVQKISAALQELDTADADFYKQNETEYLAKLDELDAAFQAAVDGAARKTLVFGDRFPFRYFADAYGLECFAAFPGCSTETEPSAKTIQFLIDKINAEKIPVVFHIELSNEKMANTISEATGAKVLLLHSCHNVSRDDFLNGESYLSLMNRNVETLKEALN
ncbi:MAG: metal ABC transporter substrate-binding protein [Oscillospiraceae bacterium]|jgi:zinc transport system substrate-binding protein|nr:metal ABC transporter substrate-binding protein [Oscillospiraceae bacterium]